MDTEKKHMLLVKKYGVRNGFDCAGPNDFKKMLKDAKKDAKKKGYFYGTSDKIFNNISKLLK